MASAVRRLHIIHVSKSWQLACEQWLHAETGVCYLSCLLVVTGISLQECRQHHFSYDFGVRLYCHCYLGSQASDGHSCLVHGAVADQSFNP